MCREIGRRARSWDRQVWRPAVSFTNWVTTPANTFRNQPKRVCLVLPIKAVLCDKKKDGWHLLQHYCIDNPPEVPVRRKRKVGGTYLEREKLARMAKPGQG